jgi:glycosyltransferase involved in cell wall biosynthesis
VATDVDGVKEAVTHNREAFLVPPRDGQKLADGIRTLLDHPDLAQRLRRAAREKVEHEFSFARRMRHVESIYRQVMHETDAIADRTTVVQCSRPPFAAAASV